MPIAIRHGIGKPMSMSAKNIGYWTIWQQQETGLRLLVAAFCVVPFWVAWVLRGGLPHDDAFITFTYARNLAQGHGFVYNGGAPYLGTTTPLRSLLLAAFNVLSPQVEIYRFAVWLGAALWSAAVVLTYRLGRRAISPLAGLLMAAFLLSIGPFPHALSMEYPLMLVCSLAALNWTLTRRYWLAGLAFGLAFLARGDAAVLAVLVGIAIWIREQRVPWALALAFTLTILPWLIYGVIVFGNPLPATLATKHAHRAVGAWPSLRIGFQNWVKGAGSQFQVWLYGTVACSVFTLVWSLIRRQLWGIVLPLWGLAYSGAYLVLDVPFYFWYSFPLLISLALGAGVGLSHLVDLGRWRERIPERLGLWRVLPGLAAILLAGGLLAVGSIAVSRTADSLRIVRTKQAAYVATGRWLAENTPRESTVGFIEVGLVGYFSQRQIVDLLGLVTPGITPFLLERDHPGIIEAYHPTYYLRNINYDVWPMNSSIHDSIYFQKHYIVIAQIPQTDGLPIIIYKHSPSVLP